MWSERITTAENPAGVTVYDGYYALVYALIADDIDDADDAVSAVLGYFPVRPGKDGRPVYHNGKKTRRGKKKDGGANAE